MAKNPDNIWKQCTSLQIQMKKSLKSNNNPFRKEIEELRTQLRKNYLYLLEDHSSFSFNDKDVLVNLWKFVFYKQIEFCRKQLRKQNKESEERTELIKKLTDKIIPDAKSVYNALLNKHLKKSFISYNNNKYNDELLSNSKYDGNMKDIKLSLQIAHKSLIYIGDLERYKETYLSNSNYDLAKSSYCLALELMPIRGNPHNQLAVLNQMQINCDLAAIYRYVLSLFVIEPFMTAKENLSLLFKKTISLVDKNDNNMLHHNHSNHHNGSNTDNIVKNITSKSTWKELQLYVIYILAIIYQDNYRSNPKYHKILNKIQPIILDKISQILLINKSNNKNKNNKNKNNDNDESEQKQKEIGEEDINNNNIIKQLCIISLFLVHETFNEDNNFIGYKQAISWTLSLIATMMEATISVNNLSLLKPITLCCLWLQNNFDFAVPNIDKSPWIEMAIDQQDLKPNNAFFTQFSKLLNLLHLKYQNDKQIINKKQQIDKIITPEQVEFYGVNQLRFINFDDIKYKQNDSFIFIYHRRYCLDENKINVGGGKGIKINNSNISKKTLNYIRYLKLVKFAQFSSQQIDGVLVFNDNKWIANNLQLTDETPPQQPQHQQLPPSAHHQQQQQHQQLPPPQHPQHHQIIMHQLTPQQSHSAQNPTTAPATNPNGPNPITHSPPSPPMNYPPLPPRQKSQPDPHTGAYRKSPQYSPNYPGSQQQQASRYNNNPSKTPNHLPSRHNNDASASYNNLRLLNPAHIGHTHTSPGHHQPRHARIHNSYPRSAPVSPRGMSGNQHQYPSQQSRAHMPAPLMEEYPEDSEITIPIPFGNSNGTFPPEHMIKSTPTTPIGAGSRHHSYHNTYDQSQQQQKHPSLTQQQHSPPQRYHPQSQQFGQPLFQQISETHSDHEYDYQHPNGNGHNNPRNNKPPTLAPPSHSHHGNVGNTHSFGLGGSRSNGGNNHSGHVYSQTPDISSSAFSFSSAYGAAASGQGYGGSSSHHGHPSNMPVTQPTTPVFASHHSSQSYSSQHHGPPPSHHNHSLYPHHSHHGHNPMTATAKYAEHSHTPNVNGHNSHNTLNPYSSIIPQQQHSGPTSMHTTGHTPNNTLFDEHELTSPLFNDPLTEEIVADVFNDLQLNVNH